MKRLMCLILMGVLAAQNPLDDGSQSPQPKKPFKLTYYDIREKIHANYDGGKVLVEFWIDERGSVESPIVRDTFDMNLNSVILDKVRQTEFYPALQNGKPVKVRYSLPIVFK
jgi:TonB family protein